MRANNFEKKPHLLRRRCSLRRSWWPCTPSTPPSSPPSWAGGSRVRVRLRLRGGHARPPRRPPRLPRGPVPCLFASLCLTLPCAFVCSFLCVVIFVFWCGLAVRKTAPCACPSACRFNRATAAHRRLGPAFFATEKRGARAARFVLTS